jgi:HD-like signal output (HDOD) protein
MDQPRSTTLVTGCWWKEPEYCGELTLPGPSKLTPEGQRLLAEIAGRAERGKIDIPPMPKAALNASRLLRSVDSELSEVAQAIEMDPVLTAHVLRYANSALFGARRAMDRVSDAVSFLGFRRMRELVASAAMHQAVDGVGSRAHAQLEWQFAINCAAISRALGERVGVDGEQCYVAGLLQDIGRLPILGLLGRANSLPEPPGADCPGEIILEVLHRGIGVQVAEAWEQPPSVRDAIGHHLVGRIAEDGPTEFPSTRVSEAAGDLCLAIGLGRPRRPFDVLEAPTLRELGFDRAALEAWLESDLPPVLEGVGGITGT